MQTSPIPLTRDIVLIGGGHTHALVLRKWGMAPLPGARLTVINPGPKAPYSGMLPGFVAGHYRRDELDIDLVRLGRFAGARVILGAVEAIDRDRREIHLPGHPPVGYDLASINVGITSHMPDLPGFAEHAVPAKPLGAFATRWAAYAGRDGPAGVVVIGGGVAGAELAMAMAHALAASGRSARVTLIDAGIALRALTDTAAGRIRRALGELGVDLVENTVIAAIGPDGVVLAGGERIAAEFVTGAAGARAYDWIAATGLTLVDGFVSVDAMLRSSDPAIFAVGDCAHLAEQPRPKAGVYAVREAPVLLANLRAAAGAGRMRRYVPQEDYLKLVSLGGRSALGERFGIALSGRLMWRWKDRIDQGFMRRFRDLPAMTPAALPRIRADGGGESGADRPLCGGCGAKIGREALQAALATLPPAPARDDITVLPGDDAALLNIGAQRQVITSDHLRAVTEDPALMARIAAVHALGDIWAMGATPQAATAMIILPRLSPALQRRTLSEVMAVAAAEMRAAGAEIVGGHSSMGDEMTIGFTVTGLCGDTPVTLAGGRPDDVLILTKPVGSGVLLAAAMAGLADGDALTAAHAHMIRQQGDAAAILSGASAMTDVTGFGLAGHLSGLCRNSGLGARLDLAAIPVMDGALELAGAGIRSTIFDDNRRLAPQLPNGGRADLLFDPQTAGGLLAAVDPAQADQVMTRLADAGYPAARIGRLVSGGDIMLQP